MTALQKIIKTAKGLQKKNKSLAWKDAIKKAGVIYRKEKKPVKYVKVKKAIGKKPVVKKAVKKKAISRPGKHTDTKSHNVRINVVSGYETQTELHLKKLIGKKVKIFNPIYEVANERGEWDIKILPTNKRFWIIDEVFYSKVKGKYFIKGNNPFSGVRHLLSFELWQDDKLSDFFKGKRLINVWDRKPYAQLKK